MATLMTKIKDFYTSEYPTDELGIDLDDDKTFLGLVSCLSKGEDVYDFVGVGDSVIRERLFSELSNIIGCDYDYIYDQWLDCNVW